MNILDFLRDIGKYINVNYMLSKDIISRRLDSVFIKLNFPLYHNNEDGAEYAPSFHLKELDII